MTIIRSMKQAGKVNLSQNLKRCGYDLNTYLQNYKDGPVKAEDINKVAVRSWVFQTIENMKGQDKDKFVKVYNRITQLVKLHILSQRLPASTFEEDMYQIYVAACICLDEKPFVC